MSEKTELKLALKKASYMIRVTTFIKGNTKDEFINDCILRDLGEAQNAKEIIKFHFALLNKMPQLRGKEFKDMLSLINLGK